jgi:hypothetical protein
MDSKGKRHQKGKEEKEKRNKLFIFNDLNSQLLDETQEVGLHHQPPPAAEREMPQSSFPYPRAINQHLSDYPDIQPCGTIATHPVIMCDGWDNTTTTTIASEDDPDIRLILEEDILRPPYYPPEGPAFDYQRENILKRSVLAMKY